MSDEFKITAVIELNSGNCQFKTANRQFQADQITANGPTPGVVAVTTGGVTISLAALTTPGFVQMTNLDGTNYVSYGLLISATYYPLGELLPGETNVFRLARDILTANTGAAVLRMKANTATCNVQVLAFDK